MIALVVGSSGAIGTVVTKKLFDNNVEVIGHCFKNSPTSPVRLVVRANLSKVKEIRNMFRCIDHLDFLVNCAGVLESLEVENLTEEEWDCVLDVNLKATFFVIQEAIKKMTTGKIISISSVAGLSTETASRHPHYAASKMGIIGLTRSLARELGPKIQVNCIAPDFIETNLTKGTPSETKDKVFDRTPLKRFITPEEVAEAVMFLLRVNITGQVICLSGGRLMY